MANIWQGKVVRMRAVEPEDWQAFFEWDADTDVARDTYNIPFPGSREAPKKWTTALAATEPKNHEYRWVIENLAGEFAGTINTQPSKTMIRWRRVVFGRTGIMGISWIGLARLSHKSGGRSPARL